MDLRALQVSATQAQPNRPQRPDSLALRLWLAVVIAALILACGRPAVAADASPMAAVKGTVNQVLTLVSSPQYKAARTTERDKLRALVAPRFDFSDMSRSAMGYDWRNLSQDQRQQFVTVFTRLLEASYMGKIESYNGQKIEYVKQTQNGDYAEVYTNIVQSGGEPISIDYRLKNENGTWKVYDVLIDSISLVGNYRAQFHRIMTEKGYNELITLIKNKEQSIDTGT
jgi:phospholipid transport system substrate-binding protein